MKIYVASSWRNKIQPYVVRILRGIGHEVYDFRTAGNGGRGFHWSSIDTNWENWSTESYKNHLNAWQAEEGFRLDFDAMKWADVLLGVQPFGISASLEMGWGSGKGKTTILLLENGEPELMVKMFDHICCNIDEVELILEDLQIDK